MNRRMKETMKRAMAGWLALLVLIAGGAAFAEEGSRQSTADLQESVVTREGEEVGTVAENIRFLVQTLKNEEVRDLLRRDDVREIFTEVVLKVLIWLYENRPVTMKVLAELGVSEKDRECVEKIWDSAERIEKAMDEFGETEDGVSLEEEIEALWNDPDVMDTVKKLLRNITSDEAVEMLKDLYAETDSPEETEGKLSPLFQDLPIDLTSLPGRVLFGILRILDTDTPESEAFLELMGNEHLRNLLKVLAARTSQVTPVAMEEYRRLREDPEVMAFARRILEELVSAKDQFLEVLEENQEKETDEPEEEASR